MGKSNRKNKKRTVAKAPETAQEQAELAAASEDETINETAEIEEPAAEGGETPEKGGKGKRGKMRGKHRKLKMCIAIGTSLALCGTGLGIGLLFIPKDGLAVTDSYGSVSYVVEEGETYAPDKGYDGLDIFGRLNWTFQQQEEWYSSYQGHVYTTVNQDVKTFKQFKDGRLISADITRSSLVNAARQFCYIPSQDRVIWREASGGPSTYNGFDTPWETGKPKGNMTISGPDGFKAKNGLPAYELSVYVFREDTIDSVDPVVDNGDGTYTVTYHMNPEVWKGEDGSYQGASVYYANQMKFTGGLTDVPSFKSITISFTFNEKWENLKTVSEEEYSATMGFTVGCKADGVTEFSYDTPYLPLSNAYEEYFKEYAQMDATGAPDPTIDGMSALASAFAPVINGPTTLSLDLTVGGKPVNGVIYLDLGMNGAAPSFSTQAEIEHFVSTLDVRAKLGNVTLWVKDGAAYVDVDGIKLKLSVSELTDFLVGLIGTDSGTENVAEIEGEEANPLDAIMNAVLNHEKGSGKANAHADLNLGGLSIPIDFNYFIDEEKLTASLDNVQTQLTVGGVSLAAKLGFTDKAAPEALTDTSDYVELADHVKNIVALIEGGNLHADIQYKNEDYGLEVKGGVDLSFPKKADGDLTDEQKKEKIKVKADLTVSYGGGKPKVVGIAYAAASNVVYLNLDGVKLSANVNEAAELVKKFLATENPGSGTVGAGFSIPKLVDTLLFTKAIADNIEITDDGTATEILLKADALIGAFGFDLGSFSLGDLTLTLAEKEISIASPALGASITLKEGKDVTLTTDGYTDIMDFANAVASIADAGYLQAHVSYSEGSIAVTGDLKLALKDLKNISAQGKFTVSYKGTMTKEKELSIIYTGGKIFLDLDGVQFAADVNEAIEIVKGFLAEEVPAAQSDSTLDKVLEKLFAFTFGDFITAEGTNDAATLTVQGTELLKKLGLNGIDLGTVKLGVASDGTITATASGVTLTAKAGTRFEVTDPGYADVTGFAQVVAGIIKGGYLTAGVQFEGYGLTVTGNITLDFKDFKGIAAKGELTVAYGAAQKALSFVYTGGTVYLDIDGLQLAANVNETIKIVKGFLATEEPAVQSDNALDKVLEKVFAFTFGDYISIIEGVEEGDLASLTVHGTGLLKALGVEFNLGEVAMNVKDNALGVKAEGGVIDVTLTVQGCDDPQISEPNYVDITEYAQAVADIIHGGYISADLTVGAYGITATGKVTLDFKDFNNISAQGSLNLTYNEATKALNFVYMNGILYLDLDGLKLAASVNEAIEIVKGFLPADKSTAGPDVEKSTLDKVLEKVFAFTFGDIKLTGKDDAVSLAVDGTKLLKALGVEFNLGNVTLDLKKDGIAAAATDGIVELNLTVKGLTEATIAAPTDHVDLTEYAQAIAKIVDTGYIAADLTFTYGDLTVEAKDLQLDIADFSDISAAGTLNLTYGKFTKAIGITYTNGVVYLIIDDMKVKANVSETIALIEDIVAPKKAAAAANGQSDSDNLKAILQKVFSILCGDALGELKETKATDEGTLDTVSLTVNGTKLLEALGVEFNLGNVTLELTKKGVTAKAEGRVIGVTVKAEGRESVSIDAVTDGDYAALNPVLNNLVTVLNKEAVSVNGGSISITVGSGEDEITLTLNLKKGVISWAKDAEGKSKLNVYLDASLIVKNTELPFKLNIVAGEKVAFAFGEELGVEIPLDDSLSSIENALLALYGRIQEMVGKMLGEGTENPLKEIESVKELGDLLLGAFGVAASGQETANAFDWTELLSKLELGRGTYSNSIAQAKFNGLTLDILSEIEGEEPGWLAIALGYTGNVEGVKIEVSGELHVNTFDEEAVPTLSIDAMPIAIKGDEIKTFLGYLGSALELFNTTDLTLEFTGKVTSTDPAYQTANDNNGVKYTIEAKMETHHNEGSLIHLDVDGKNLWVDGSVYAHASINVKAANEKDTSLYIDLFIVDGAPNTTDEATGEVSVEGEAAKDGILDFYITLSQFGPVGTTTESVPGYNPVRLYAPSSEILTILSAALPTLGVDVDILNNYMVSKWITDLKTVDQLKAFNPLVGGLLGENVQNTIGEVSGFINKLFGGKDGTAAPTPAAISELQPDATPAADPTPFKLGDYLKGLHIGAAEAEGKTELSVTLNSKGIYAQDGLEDVKATLIKTDDTVAEDGTITYGKFEEFDLLNIYGNNCTENTSLKGTISYGTIEAALPTGSYQSFLGAEKLILSLVNSATHGVDENGDVISGEEAAHTYVVNNNFYISGTITAKLLDIVDVTIDLVAISVNVDENGELGINVRLQYQGKWVLVTAINGDSTVDITIKGGMVYMKRVQKTYYSTEIFNSGWKEYETPITLYRAMPMANFTGDMLGQLGFILNFGEMINNAISDGSAGGGDESTTPDPAAKVDFGTTLASVLKKYSFTEEGSSQKWHLEINGSSFSNGILGDVTVDMGASDGLFKTFNVTKLQVNIPAGSIKLGLTASLDLTWHNPGGISDGVDDQTDYELAGKLADRTHGLGAMIEKVNAENGWTQTADDGTVTYKYLEAQAATVTYKYRDYAGTETDFSAPQQQNVMVSTGQGGWEANTLFSELTLPAIPTDDEQFAYRALEVSAPVGEVLNSFNFVLAEQSIKEYDVTFYTTDETLGTQFGWEYDEAEHRYYHTQSMKYGSIVDMGGKSSTITGTQQFEIAANPTSDDGRPGTWQGKPDITGDGAKFTATYPATVIYKSTVQFSIGGCDVTDTDGVWSATTQFSETDYTLLTPSADGYTFLGWFVNDGGWKNVTTLNASEAASFTVEALWITNYTVTITNVKADYKIDISYDYTIEAAIGENGGMVKCSAELAKVVSTQVHYRYYVNNNENNEVGTSNEQYDKGSDMYTDKVTFNIRGVKKKQAHVAVYFSYTVDGGDPINGETVYACKKI